MKKLAITLSFAVLCTTAGAQGMLDAINYGKSNYYGTARTMAIGNATTAVGSDIGSIIINPAGAAVASYNQVTFTPGVSIACTDASYAPAHVQGEQPVFGAANTTNSTRFVVPNGGVTFIIPMGYSGLKNFTIGFVSNLTDNYLEDHMASGTTGDTSITGAFALAANDSGMPGDLIGSESSYSSNYSWNSITAYIAKMINFLPTGYDPLKGYYYGSAEGKGTVGGNMNQISGASKSGTKNDFAFNFSGNVDDKFYFGANLGISSGTYRNNEYYKETPEKSSEFPITPMNYQTVENDTYYTGCTYNYNCIASMSGIYGKFGIIALPTKWLRVGAAIKTPTAFNIRERWQISCSTTFEQTSSNKKCTSPEGSYSYKYRSPYEFNLGLAATIGGIAMVSADYEMTDYSIMKFSNGNSLNDPFSAANNLIKKFCGVSHALRVGAEFNLQNVLFFRAGLGFTTDPERTLWNTNKNVSVSAAEYSMSQEIRSDYEKHPEYYEKGSYIDNTVSFYSAGIGFRSRGSFFADLAVRMTQSKSSYQPFNDYYSTSCGYPNNICSPYVSTVRRLWDVALTIGFRF